MIVEIESTRWLVETPRVADKHIPFEVPRGPELAARLSSVLEVIYLIFNEGYSAATTGDDLMRPTLCEDARELAELLSVRYFSARSGSVPP
jgi:predicted RNA polymerase sigma factor